LTRWPSARPWPGAWLPSIVRQIIRYCPKPLVVDADALFALAGHTSLLLKAPAPRVLTPHAGEMARLNSQAVAQTEGQRLKAARILPGPTTAFFCLRPSDRGRVLKG